MEYIAESVDEAITLAEKFKAEGKYDWFRGQTQSWPPRSTLLRFQQLNPNSWQESIQRTYGHYFRFLAENVELMLLKEDVESAFAVAQHYGIPTTLIDFTTDPAVAGFFACDTHDPLPEGTSSYIYCLDTSDLAEMWEIFGQTPVNFLTPAVPNLWRMESQHGVFLEISLGNWDEWYPMDRIVFPHSAAPAFPPRDVIYPVNKSALEILLDEFLSAEKLRLGNAELNRIMEELGVQTIRIDGHPERVSPGFFRNGTPAFHESWGAVRLAEWRDSRVETIRDGSERTIPLTLNPTAGAKSLGSSASTAARAAMRLYRHMRNERVAWRIVGPPLSTVVKDNADLEKALLRLWDGMRGLPYTDADLAVAIGRTVELFARGLHPAIFSSAENEIARAVMGDSIKTEFGARDESYSRGLASAEALRSAWRSDLPDLVADRNGLDAGDVRSVLRAVSDPRILFNFDELCGLFPPVLVPWQLLTRREPIYFSPARLTLFGLQQRAAD